jgi:hypothetical protein
MAQVSSNAETTGVWAAATVLASSLVLSIGKLFADWKTNRTQENILNDIKEVNREQTTHIIKLTVQMEKQEAVRSEQHDANLRTMKDLCRAPYYFKYKQSMYQPQKDQSEKEMNE